MVKRLFVLAFAIALLPEAGAAAPDPPVEAMYADALAKEKAVRTAFAGTPGLPTVLKAARTVIGDYEALVGRYPTSGYCDDALWRAGNLAIAAFQMFEERQDRTAALRLLSALASEYPTSKLARRVPDLVAGIDLTPAAAPPAAESRPAKLATIREIRRELMADGVRVTIEIDSEVAFHEERLRNPSRVFVDLTSTRAAPPLVDQTLRFDDGADLVRQIRVGRHPNGTTRVVLDATGAAGCGVYPLYSPYRLVIDCVRAAPAVASMTGATALPAPGTPLAPRRVVPDWAGPLPSPSPSEAGALREARVPDTTPAAVRPLAPASLPARNLNGGFSMARQLGLGVSRIVIDPGHGGHDPGATGRGITEAGLVLDVALRLEKLLTGVPGVEVVLTRRTDTFVPLQERTSIANREGADLFLSIHANASANIQAQGVETYFLNFATSRTAEAVAARENAASEQAMGALPDFVKAIALNNKLDESRDLATFIQRAMIDRLKGTNKSVKDLGVKQAPFVVLIGAAMPSALTEVSFVTNAPEARLLRGSAYRQRIAEALFNAIRKYQMSLKTVGKLALRP